MQYLIRKKFIYYLKNNSFYDWGVLIFLYGIFHSIGPGHGKVFLLSLSTKSDKKKLIAYSAFIAYFQGVFSFLLVYLFIKLGYDYNIGDIQHIDKISKNTYGVSLILLAGINLIGEFLEEKVKNKFKDKFFILGNLFPCSGVLTILLAVILLGYKKYLLISSLIMATGMFITLTIFSIILDKISIEKTESSSNHFSYIFYCIILLLGIYIVLR